jgi:hypothetical protein
MAAFLLSLALLDSIRFLAGLPVGPADVTQVSHPARKRVRWLRLVCAARSISGFVWKDAASCIRIAAGAGALQFHRAQSLSEPLVDSRSIGQAESIPRSQEGARLKRINQHRP